MLYCLTRENKEMGVETNKQLGFRKENKFFLHISRVNSLCKSFTLKCIILVAYRYFCVLRRSHTYHSIPQDVLDIPQSMKSFPVSSLTTISYKFGLVLYGLRCSMGKWQRQKLSSNFSSDTQDSLKSSSSGYPFQEKQREIFYVFDKNFRCYLI